MISFIFYRFKKTSLLTNKSAQQNFALSPLLLPFPLRHYRAKNHRASPPSSSRDDFRPGLSCFNTCSAQKSAPRLGDKPISAPLYSSRDFSILLAVNILLSPRHQIPIVSFPLGRSRFGNVVSRSLSSSARFCARTRPRPRYEILSAPPRNQISLSVIIDYRDVIGF